MDKEFELWNQYYHEEGMREADKLGDMDIMEIYGTAHTRMEAMEYGTNPSR